MFGNIKERYKGEYVVAVGLLKKLVDASWNLN